MKIKFDPIHINIPITKLEEATINSGLFNRLQYIMQTSTSYFTFPSLKHSRYSHSIGTMHIAGRMFCNIVRNTKKDVLDNLFENIEKIINENILNIDSLDTSGTDGDIRKLLEDFYRRERNNFQFNNFINEDFLVIQNNSFNILKYADEQKLEIYYIILQTLRIVGLLHDVGHMPFSHLFEDVLKEIHGELIDKKEKSENETEAYELLDIMMAHRSCGGRSSDDPTIKEKEFLNLCIKQRLTAEEEEYFNRLKQPVPVHEYLGEIISLLIFNEQINSSLWTDNQKILIHIIKKLVQMTYAEIKIDNFDFKVLHQLVDGPIDADRLDYVARDIWHSGLNLLSFDTNRIIENIKYNDNMNLVFSSLVLSDIEKFFVSRYESYNEIIFHHKVVRTNKILEEVIRSQIEQVLKRDGKLFAGTPDYILNSNIEGLFDALFSIIKSNSFDKFKSSLINQFEENWLLRMLKIIRFSLENKGSGCTGEEQFILSCLREVLDGEEKFITLWDNKEIFRDDIYKTIISNDHYSDLNEFDFKSFFDDYISIEMLESFEPKIVEKVTLLNGELSEDNKLIFYIRKFSLGTSGINQIFIDYLGEEKRLSDVSGIEDRLRTRVSENIQVLFFINTKEVDSVKSKLLSIIADEIMEFMISILIVDVILQKDDIEEFENVLCKIKEIVGEERYRRIEKLILAKAYADTHIDAEEYGVSIKFLQDLSLCGKALLKDHINEVAPLILKSQLGGE